MGFVDSGDVAVPLMLLELDDCADFVVYDDETSITGVSITALHLL